MGGNIEPKAASQPLWKSSVVWVSTIANVAAIVALVWPSLDIAPWVRIAGIVVTMLVQFGILNNGTNPKGFGANKTEK